MEPNQDNDVVATRSSSSFIYSDGNESSQHSPTGLPRLCAQNSEITSSAQPQEDTHPSCLQAALNNERNYGMQYFEKAKCTHDNSLTEAPLIKNCKEYSIESFNVLNDIEMKSENADPAFDKVQNMEVRCDVDKNCTETMSQDNSAVSGRVSDSQYTKCWVSGDNFDSSNMDSNERAYGVTKLSDSSLSVNEQLVSREKRAIVCEYQSRILHSETNRNENNLSEIVKNLTATAMHEHSNISQSGSSSEHELETVIHLVEYAENPGPNDASDSQKRLEPHGDNMDLHFKTCNSAKNKDSLKSIHDSIPCVSSRVEGSVSNETMDDSIYSNDKLHRQSDVQSISRDRSISSFDKSQAGNSGEKYISASSEPENNSDIPNLDDGQGVHVSNSQERNARTTNADNGISSYENMCQNVSNEYGSNPEKAFVHASGPSNAIGLVSSYIPEATNVFSPGSALAKLSTTFDATKVWIQCAENAAQQAIEYDFSIAENFHKTVLEGLKQFVATVKDASKKCIDSATAFVPSLQSLAEEYASVHELDFLQTSDMNQEANMITSQVASHSNEQTNRPVTTESPSKKLNDGRVRKRGRPRKSTRPSPRLASKRKRIVYKDESETENEANLVDDNDDSELPSQETPAKKQKKRNPTPTKTPQNMQINIKQEQPEEETTVSAYTVTSRKTRTTSEFPKCPDCKVPHSNQEELISHLETEHNRTLLSLCKQCPKVFLSEKALKKHAKDVHRKNKRCDQCGKTFAYQYELDMHAASFHTGNLPFKCRYCNFACPKQGRLNLHMRTKHRDKPIGSIRKQSRKRNNDSEEEQWQDSPNAGHLCIICNSNFPSNAELKEHIKVHLSEKEAVNDGSDTEVEGEEVKIEENSKPASAHCTMCDIDFPSVASFKQHMKTSHKENQSADNDDSEYDTNVNSILQTLDMLNAESAEEEESETAEKRGRFQCQKCSSSFHTERLLRQHVHRVHNKRLSCDMCGKKFAYPHELQEHERIHSSDKAIPCDFCEKPYRTRALLLSHAKLQHPEETKELRYKCPVCLARFPLKAHLENHQKTHKSIVGEPVTYTCSICFMQFQSVDKVKAHEKAMHKNEISPPRKTSDKQETEENMDSVKEQAESEDKTDSNSIDPIPNKKMCIRCGAEFATNAELNAHRKEVHAWQPNANFVCKECGKECINKESLRNHKRRVHKKNRECTICGKSFAFQYILERHILTHTGERNFVCQVCNKNFYTIKELNVHVRLSHTERAFKCEQCPSKFGTKQGLERHIIHLHTNHRPKVCEFCGKGFVDKRELNAHIFTHTRVSDIKCQHCDKMFGTRSCLNKHIRFVHNGEKKLCPICGKHIVSHLGMHIKSHGEKRFKCDQCPKVYAWPSALKEHKRTHTGEKPYKCPVCDKTFLGSANFVKHKKIHVKNANKAKKGLSNKSPEVDKGSTAAKNDTVEAPIRPTENSSLNVPANFMQPADYNYLQANYPQFFVG